jgi:hypothetical protein
MSFFRVLPIVATYQLSHLNLYYDRYKQSLFNNKMSYIDHNKDLNDLIDRLRQLEEHEKKT